VPRGSDVEPRDAEDAERFWRIIEAAPDGFVMVDATGTILLVNQQTERIFGYARDDLLGQPVELLLPRHLRTTHESDRARYNADPHTRPMGVGIDLVGLHRDGHEFPVEVSLSPLDADRTIAVVRDVSSRREAERQLRSAKEHVRLLEDRERIARDLHDHVIQRLFAAGMSLEGVAARSDDVEVTGRVARVVDDLDDTIRQLRSVIFDLQDRDRATASGLRSELSRVLAEARPALGHEPRVRFEGPIDTMGDRIAEQVLAVLREALTNVGRHAQATSTDVRVVAGPDEFVLEVIDDGVGIDPAPRTGHGVPNVEQRAHDLGGSCELGPGPQGGTRLRWRVPLDR
jgi:PAS domain S-box-containing protein